jgi:hypothetical protein
MRSPHNQQRARPHALQYLPKNLPLLRTRSAHERSDIDDVEIAQVVLRAACAVAAEGHGGRGDGEALAEFGCAGDGVGVPVYVKDERLGARGRRGGRGGELGKDAQGG